MEINLNNIKIKIEKTDGMVIDHEALKKSSDILRDSDDPIDIDFLVDETEKMNGKRLKEINIITMNVFSGEQIMFTATDEKLKQIGTFFLANTKDLDIEDCPF